MSTGPSIELWSAIRQSLKVDVSEDGRLIVFENTSIKSPFIPTVRFTGIMISMGVIPE